MQPEHLSYSHNGNASDDRADGVLVADGVDSVSAFVLRHWRTGANPPEPVFVTWLLPASRFSLKRGE